MASKKAQLPIEFTASKKLSAYLKRINIGWQKTTDSLMAVAKVCAEANGTLAAHEKRALLEHLPFSGATFSKLAIIGADKRLHSQKMRQLLPPSYSIIYEVTHLKDNELKTAVSKKVISPSASRADIMRFVSHDATVKNGGAASGKTAATGFLAEIRLPLNAKRADVEKINRILIDLEAQHGAVVLRPKDMPSYQRLMDKYNQAIGQLETKTLKTMRALLKKRIAAEKKRKKARNEKWGFLSDETDLNVLPDELSDRIRSVMAVLGWDGDFDDLRDEAEQKTKSKRMDDLSRKLEAVPFGDISDTDNLKELEALKKLTGRKGFLKVVGLKMT